MNKIIIKIAMYITYLQTGIDGSKSMSLSDFMVYLPEYKFNKAMVTDVIWCLLAVIILEVLFRLNNKFKIVSRIKELLY